ncbi:MAG: hypothetical protein ACUVTY_11920 [Armatimonadota bacterium]
MPISAIQHAGLTKGQRKEWRRKGYVTAILYGNGIEPKQLLVPVREIVHSIVEQEGKQKAVLEVTVGSDQLKVQVKEIHVTSPPRNRYILIFTQ